MSSQTCKMKVLQKGKPVTLACSTFRSTFVYRCRKVSPRDRHHQPGVPGYQGTTQGSCGQSWRPRRPWSYFESSHSPWLLQGWRWTQLHVALLPSRSSSCGWVKLDLSDHSCSSTAFISDRNTDSLYLAKPIKRLQGLSLNISITHKSVQCSSQASTPTTARAPTVTA